MNGKKGLVIALVALVAVVAIAGVAYGALVPKASEKVNANDVISAVQGGATSGQSSTSGSQAASQELDDFTVFDLEGNEVKLSSMEGKPVFLGYWATWCPPCMQEAPAIQELYEKYGDKVNFVMVNATDGTRETPEGVKAWYAEKGFTYPIYLDTKLEASRAGAVQYLPTTYLLDAQGNIVTSLRGAITVEDGSKMLDALL